MASWGLRSIIGNPLIEGSDFGFLSFTAGEVAEVQTRLGSLPLSKLWVGKDLAAWLSSVQASQLLCGFGLRAATAGARLPKCARQFFRAVGTSSLGYVKIHVAVRRMIFRAV